MVFKTPRLIFEFDSLPKILRDMADQFDTMCNDEYSIDPVVTRVLGAVAGSSGVHEAGRAIDFRDEHGGVFLYSQEAREWLVKEMNRIYSRNDSKLTLYWHSFRGAPHHFHLQLASNMEVYDVR